MGLMITYQGHHNGCNNPVYSAHKKHGCMVYVGAHFTQQNMHILMAIYLIPESYP